MRAFRHAPTRAPGAPIAGVARGEEGFGLIECLVAMLVLMAVLVPTAYLFTNVLGQSATARQRITALSFAEQIIENLNNSGPPTDANNEPEVGTTLSEGTKTLSGIPYTASAIFQWTDASGGTPDFCDSGTSPVLALQVTVKWGSGQSITDQAILNFPATGTIANGYLAIQVNGDPAGNPPNDASGVTWANRVTNVPIEVSGSSLTTPYSLTPGANGCTFLAAAPGTYTVQVGPGPSSPAPYVANYNEASSETQALSNQSPITVVAAQVTQVTFQYDEGAYIDLSYPSSTAIDDGISCPNTSFLICLAMGQTAASATAPAASPVADGIARKSSGWSTASFPSTMSRIEGLACTSSTCIAVGYGSSGGSAAVSTNGTSWSNSSLPESANVTQLTSISCPSGATTLNCIAIGTSSSGSGVILTATVSGSTVSWTNDTVPSNTGFSELTCPSTTTQPVCFVLGTTSGGPTILSNTGSSSPGTSWHAFSESGVSMTSITSLVCNSPTFCMALGSSTSGYYWYTYTTPEIISIASVSGTTVVWKPYTASGMTVDSLTTLACAPSGNYCWAGGTGQTNWWGSGSPMILYCNTSSGSQCASGSNGSTWTSDSVPSSVSAITSLTCPSSTACFALDSTSSSAGVLSLSGTTWSAASLPNASNVVSTTQLTCATGTSCFVAGTTSTAAFVDVLASGSWSATSFTNTKAGASPVYISGIGCTAATTCFMAGATESAGQVFDYTSSGAKFDAGGTPNSLTGMYLSNPPIMVSNSNLQPSTVVEMSAPTTSNGPQTEVGPLFPFSSGYSVSVGYCSSEATANSVTAASAPGGTSTLNAPLEMGILPIEAVDSNGNALSNATISIVDQTCSSQLVPQSSGSYPALSNPPANPSNPTSYAMPNSAVDGLSRIAVIYGTYQVTVTSGNQHATTTVTVNPTSIVVGTNSQTTYYMPAYVPIPD